MLDLLRRKAQSPYIQATILIIVLTFVFWGIGSKRWGQKNTVATVNDWEISYQQYQRAYEQQLSQLRDRFKGVIPKGLLEAMHLKEQVLNMLINETLIEQAAHEAGIIVSKEEVRAAIHKIAAFQVNGIFNMNNYQQALANSRLTVGEFENSIRQEILNKKITAQLNQFARINDQELKERFRFENQEVNLEYVVFSAANFKDKVTVKTEALTKFFDENKSNYKTQPQIKLKYLFFPYEGGATPEKSKKEAANKANEAYKNIILAGSLGKYAESSKAAIEETGYFSKNAPPKEFATNKAILDAAFSLKKGELSSLIEGQQGYAIIYVDDVKEPEIPPLETVEDQVRQDFIAKQAEELAKQAAETLLAELKDGASLQDKAKQLGVEVKESGFISRATRASVPLPPAITETAFRLTKAKPLPDEIAASGPRYYVYRLKERKEPDPKLFDEKKTDLLVQLTQENRLQLQEAWVAFLRQRATIDINESLIK